MYYCTLIINTLFGKRKILAVETILSYMPIHATHTHMSRLTIQS